MIDASQYANVPIGLILTQLGVSRPEHIGYFDTLESIRSDPAKYYAAISCLVNRLRG